MTAVLPSPPSGDAGTDESPPPPMPVPPLSDDAGTGESPPPPVPVPV
eukprot:CAMPEP_0198342822 /NCGR_PEP_ID=MMETSP1450-20131203/55439_1 /TAXON_ID=753684 ORGANISM="Madagascaria erythrocladiodes, Strain CCMP3234" /NCGR_SAMPLE_ID=MMETSP1450 /ASSEMBLY_ACC=CAM_ASM_001115 /LENGTH=46 /DNA_ID= /DNA_START= /DNA_END= /DNA_ORIENTATION=